MINRKIYRLHLRLDYKSNQKLKSISKKSKLSKSEIFRRFINDLEIKEKPDDEFYEAINKLISIENNLQVISDKAEYLNDINSEMYKQEMQKWNILINDLREKYL